MELVEPLGQETLVHGVVEPGSELLPGGPAVLALGPDQQVKAGDHCHFGVRPESIHTFDLQTGKRLD